MLLNLHTKIYSPNNIAKELIIYNLLNFYCYICEFKQVILLANYINPINNIFFI